MKPNKVDIYFKNKNFKFYKFARFMCLIFPVLYMVFIFLLMMQTNLGYQELIVKTPILTAGFFICFMNFFMWLRTRKALDEITSPANIAQFKLRSTIYAFAQLIMFNYPAAILFALTLYKNFNWTKQSFMQTIQLCKKERLIIPLVIDICVIALFIFLATWFAAAFSK
ncbi:MAG: hypothetical protein RR562_05535 [Longicatena sp.]